MARKRKRSSRSRPSTARPRPAEALQPTEAQSVFKKLLEAHPELRDEADKHALELVKASAFEGIAEFLDMDLRHLGLDELGRRAGNHGAGYVDPGEAGWEACQEVLDPLLEEMARQLKLGLKADALETLKGIVLGLYLAREDRGDGCLAWAPDFPLSAAVDAVERSHHGTSAKSSPGRRSRSGASLDMVLSFVAEQAPEWKGSMERVAERIQRGK